MTRGERVALATLAAQVDALLDGPKDCGILNIDVLEALLGDIRKMAAGYPPREVAKLAAGDEAA